MSHFRVSIRSEGSDTPEEATESKVKSKRLFFFVRWFVRIIDNIIERQQRIPDDILALEREQTQMLKTLTGAG